MPMDDWLKGVIAGSGAVLVATAWSMRSTEKLLKEAEIDFANPEFGVTPKEDFSDSVRQNLAVGGYSFNAESPSGDDPTAADPSSEGGPAELFDESVVQDEQDSGVDFMNAENSSKIKDYILVDQSGSTGIMQIAMSAIVREAVSNSMDAGHDVEIIGYDTHVHPYTEDPREYLHTSRGATQPWRALDYIAAQNGGKLPTNANYQFIIDEDFDLRSLGRFDKELNESNTKIMCVTSQRGYFGNLPDGVAEETLNKWITRWNAYNTGIPMSALVVKSDKETMDSYDDTGKLPKGFKFGYNPHEDYVDGSITKMQMMNAESPLEVSPPLTEEPSDMGGPEDFSADEWPHKWINDPTKEYVPTWRRWAQLTPEEKELENASYIDRYGKVPSWIESARISPEERHSATSKRIKELENEPDIDLRKRKIMTDIENMVKVGVADNPAQGPSNLRGIDFFQDYDTNAKYFIIDADSHQSIMNGDSNVVGYWMEDEWIEIGASETGEFLLSDDIHMISNLWLYYVINPEEILNDSVVSEFVIMNTIQKERKENFGAENYGSKDARRAQWARRMQGYNDRDDESIGVRNTTTGEQSLKDRRDESKGMTGSLNPHHPYSDVSTMSAEGCSWCGNPKGWNGKDCLTCNRGDFEDKDMETMSAEARRWRLPKTSKGTALYAKRDESGRFTDIQNVARSTRADRARIAANQGVKSGKGDEGERMIYEAEFQTLTDHVSTMYAAESQDLILCAHCDKKMSECVPHSSEVFEAPASGYPVFMSAKDAAAVFAKNKNKLCTVTFMKKDGTMRTMRGRTGVFRDKSGKTIVGTGKKPSWDAKARAAAGYMTFFDVEAAKKAGDNRKGFRMINLNTITEIKAMGRTFDGAHPQGF
jgi:hypothetical protein